MAGSPTAAVDESPAPAAQASGPAPSPESGRPSRSGRAGARTSAGGLAIRIAGVILGLAFFWVAARGVDVDAALVVLAAADRLTCAGVLMAALAFMVLKALRWSWVLVPVVSVRFGLLHRLVYVGTAANILLPHSGELVRSIQLARAHPNALYSGTVLGTVAVERLLDFAVLTLFAAAAIVMEPSVSQWLWLAGVISLVLVLTGVGLTVAVLDPDTRLRRIGHSLVSRIPARAGERLHHHVCRGIEGLGALREPRRLLVALLLSLLQWAMVVLAIALSCQAVGQPVSVSAATAVFVLTVIGLTLPSAPGQVGTTQLAFVTGLAFSGGTFSTAFAASIIYNVWFVIATMMIGAVLWLRPPRSPRPPRPLQPPPPPPAGS